MPAARILILDSSREAEKLYASALAPLELQELVLVDKSEVAIRRVREESFGLVLVTLGAEPAEGWELLKAARQVDARLPVIVVDERPTVDSAAESLRLGAADYLTQPLEPAHLAATVRRLLEERRLEDENDLLRRQVERSYSFDRIIGTSHSMREVYQTVDRVAESDVDVLIIGETGTGKELVARGIHQRSKRAESPFVPIDCGAIPENLLESEFFGHERGAFTGADSRRIGLLEYAHGGTFFLDELGELPLLMQAKLLRALQERKIRRVGGRDLIDIDVRIVAATGRNLDTMMQQGQFREDLYYRINVVRIELPPLRDRGDDIGLLAEYFATRYSREMGRGPAGITPEAYQVLQQYHWPGNVRELQNVIRRALALSPHNMIGLDSLPDNLVAEAGQRRSSLGQAGADAGKTAAHITASSSRADAETSGTESLGYFQLRDEYLAQFEREYLSQLLLRHQGDVKTAAVEAQVPRGTLYRLMKNHGLDGAQFRSKADSETSG